MQAARGDGEEIKARGYLSVATEDDFGAEFIADSKGPPATTATFSRS